MPFVEMGLVKILPKADELINEAYGAAGWKDAAERFWAVIPVDPNAPPPEVQAQQAQAEADAAAAQEQMAMEADQADQQRSPLSATRERRSISPGGSRDPSERGPFTDGPMRQEAAMALAPTLQKYLADQGVTYNVISHARTTSSLETVQTSHIPADCFAKGILLRDQQGYWLAVLPASRHVQLSDLRTNLGDRVGLASEEEVAEVFPDCARGAIPPFSECYGLDVIVDSSIDQQPELYCEGGDHETLVHMSQAEFARLNRQARHGSFTSPN